LRRGSSATWVARLLVAALAFAALLFAAPATAQKTDVVVLNNGDRITGEIKEYGEGKLSVDTSHS